MHPFRRFGLHSEAGRLEQFFSLLRVWLLESGANDATEDIYGIMARQKQDLLNGNRLRP